MLHLHALAGGFTLTSAFPLTTAPVPTFTFTFHNTMPRPELAPPVSELRGVVSFDTEELLVLVRAPVERAAKALRSHQKLDTWVRDAPGKEVVVSDPSFVVYRLRGHPWTIIDGYRSRSSRLQPEDACTLSKLLSTRAIFYGNSDTAGVTCYDLFEEGRRLEHFAAYEGIEFDSVVRQVPPPPDGEEIYDFVDALMREQDALAPGWSTQLGGWSREPGERVTIVPEEGPDLFERLDYLG